MNPVSRLFVRINTSLYQFTNGRVGSNLGTQSVLLLYSIGRKSGKTYVTPLSFYRDSENYVVAGSNWGSEQPPDWLKNLLVQPHTQIQILDKTFDVSASLAEGAERERLWKLVAARNAQILEYQAGLKRQIPIVILHPQEKSETRS